MLDFEKWARRREGYHEFPHGKILDYHHREPVGLVQANDRLNQFNSCAATGYFFSYSSGLT